MKIPSWWFYSRRQEPAMIIMPILPVIPSIEEQLDAMKEASS